MFCKSCLICLAVSAADMLIVLVMVLYRYLLILSGYWFCIGTCNRVELCNTVVKLVDAKIR